MHCECIPQTTPTTHRDLTVLRRICLCTLFLIGGGSLIAFAILLSPSSSGTATDSIIMSNMSDSHVLALHQNGSVLESCDDTLPTCKIAMQSWKIPHGDFAIVMRIETNPNPNPNYVASVTEKFVYNNETIRPTSCSCTPIGPNPNPADYCNKSDVENCIGFSYVGFICSQAPITFMDPAKYCIADRRYYRFDSPELGIGYENDDSNMTDALKDIHLYVATSNWIRFYIQTPIVTNTSFSWKTSTSTTYLFSMDRMYENVIVTTSIRFIDSEYPEYSEQHHYYCFPEYNKNANWSLLHVTPRNAYYNFSVKPYGITNPNPCCNMTVGIGTKSKIITCDVGTTIPICEINHECPFFPPTGGNYVCKSGNWKTGRTATTQMCQ